MTTPTATTENTDSQTQAANGFADFDLLGDAPKAEAGATSDKDGSGEGRETEPTGGAGRTPATISDPATDQSGATKAEATEQEKAEASGQPPAAPPKGAAGAEAKKTDGDEPPTRQQDAAAAGILADLRETRAELKAAREERAALIDMIKEMRSERAGAVTKTAEPERDDLVEAAVEKLTKRGDFVAMSPAEAARAIAETVAEMVRAEAGRVDKNVSQKVDETETRARFENSHARAVDTYGKENVDRVVDWVKKLGPEAGIYFSNQADPMQAAIAAYNDEANKAIYRDPKRASAHLLSDPKAREEIEKELRAKLRAEIEAELRQGKPAPTPPPSLAGQPKGGLSEAATGSFKDAAAAFLN